MALQTINIGASANDGSGDPLRTAMDKINDNFGAAGTGVFNVMHPDYGAVGNGVANDTTAINAASAAASAAGGGIVRFPFTPDSYNFTFTLPDVGVKWEFDGAGDLIDRTKVGGASGVKSFDTELYHLGGPHNTGSPYRQAAKFTRVIAEGSGGNTYSDVIQSYWIEKPNYLTTEEPGEFVAMEVFVRNGGPTAGGSAGQSSSGGIIIDVLSSDGSGFSCASETATKVANSSGTILHYIDMQYGVCNSRDGDYYGIVCNSITGTQDAAILVADESGSSWNDAFRNSHNDTVNFKIGVDGKVTTKTDDSGNTEINFLNTADVLEFKKAGGGTALFSINQSLALAPILAGGTGTTSPLTLRSTTGTGTTGADIIFQVGTNGGTEAARILNSGFMGVGTATPGFVFQSGGTAAAGNFNALGGLNNATNASTSCTLLFTNSTSHDVQSAYIRATRDNVPASGGTSLDFATFNGTTTTSKFGIDGRGTIYIPNTITAAGTTGDRTIDKVAGSVNIAAGNSTVTVTCARASASTSLVYCSLGTVDATAKTAVGVASNGSIAITLNAAATGEVRVNFLVIN